MPGTRNKRKSSASSSSSSAIQPKPRKAKLQTPREKHLAEEALRLTNIEIATAALAKEAIHVSDTPYRLQDEAAKYANQKEVVAQMRAEQREKLANAQAEANANDENEPSMADLLGEDGTEKEEILPSVPRIRKRPPLPSDGEEEEE